MSLGWNGINPSKPESAPEFAIMELRVFKRSFFYLEDNLMPNVLLISC